MNQVFLNTYTEFWIQKLKSYMDTVPRMGNFPSRREMWGSRFFDKLSHCSRRDTRLIFFSLFRNKSDNFRLFSGQNMTQKDRPILSSRMRGKDNLLK